MVQSPVRLVWIPGYSPVEGAAQFVAGNMVMAGVREVTTPLMPFVPYRFKDLNPERPYLILNSTSGTEDDPQGCVMATSSLSPVTTSKSI